MAFVLIPYPEILTKYLLKNKKHHTYNTYFLKVNFLICIQWYGILIIKIFSQWLSILEKKHFFKFDETQGLDYISNDVEFVLIPK